MQNVRSYGIYFFLTWLHDAAAFFELKFLVLKQ